MNDEFEEKLKELQLKYSENLPDKIAEIQCIWRKLSIFYDPAMAKALCRMLHKLQGSAGTYSYPFITQVTREVEIILENNPTHLNEDMLKKVDELMSTLTLHQITNKK